MYAACHWIVWAESSVNLAWTTVQGEVRQLFEAVTLAASAVRGTSTASDAASAATKRGAAGRGARAL